MNTML